MKNGTSIGTSTNKFMGTFDGGGKTIKGLTDGGKSGTYGLFGYVQDAVIKNIKLADVDMSYKYGMNRGALTGPVYGSSVIENIEVSGSIAGSDYLWEESSEGRIFQMIQMYLLFQIVLTMPLSEGRPKSRRYHRICSG